MTFIHQPLSAIDRARIAYERMIARKREAAVARELREHRRFVRLAAGGGILLVLFLGTAIYNDWLPSARSALSRDRTSADFGKTRTGQVRSFVKGDTCQELQFDNVSGTYVGASLVPCDVVVRKDAAPPPQSGTRVFSIRDAFTR